MPKPSPRQPAKTERAAAPKRELWQLCTRLSGTFAVAGLLLGLGGHWTVAYVIFAIGAALAAAAYVLSSRDRAGRQ